MISITICCGRWVLIHLVLFGRVERQENEKVDLTGIGGDNILADNTEDEELAAKCRPFGFGRRN